MSDVFGECVSWLSLPHRFIQGWNADINDKAPWIKLDLECVSHILGISTAGRSDRAEWVAQYRVCTR
jgi:hypothetical protein